MNFVIENDKKNYKGFITKFINLLMIDGKKLKSEKIFLEVLNHLYNRDKNFSLEILEKAFKNLSPLVTVRSVKIRRRSYQVPIPLKESQRIMIGMKWLINYCRKLKLTKINSFSFYLSEQIFLASQRQGELVKKKYDLHKLAKTNRLFSNYRWF